DLGGASVHSTLSGNVHFTAPTEEEVLENVRKLIAFLPQNNLEKTPKKEPEVSRAIDERIDELLDIVPIDGKKAYDVRKVIMAIIDDANFMEVQPLYAKNIVCGFARFDG